MAATFEFNPDQIAYCEANGWRAYYEHKWFKLLNLTVRLCQEQFRIPFPVSLLAAYYVTRGAAAWVPVDHDEKTVLKYYEKFYRIARRYSTLTFDPVKVARLEMEYWDVHRQLVGNPDKSRFIETMIELHAAVFDLASEQARESAELRVLACNTVDLITGKLSTDVPGDWAKLESYLRDCYRSIQRELKKERAIASRG
jgi:hypothetical protein